MAFSVCYLNEKDQTNCTLKPFFFFFQHVFLYHVLSKYICILVNIQVFRKEATLSLQARIKLNCLLVEMLRIILFSIS